MENVQAINRALRAIRDNPAEFFSPGITRIKQDVEVLKELKGDLIQRLIREGVEIVPANFYWGLKENCN